MSEMNQSDFDKYFSSAKMNKLENGIEKNQFFFDWIDNQAWDANTKEILKKVLEITITVGKKTYQFGKMMLRFLQNIAKEWPNLTKGAIMGLLFGVLVHMIPILGPILSPYALPLGLTCGAIIGLGVDLIEKAETMISDMFC